VEKKFVRFVGPVLGSKKAEQLLARIGDALASGAFAALATEIETSCRDALTR
jgi:hypothetical protein